MELPRYIVLSDVILDRERIIMIFMDNDRPGVIHVEMDGAERLHFDGGDAVKLWRMFDTDAGWREPE